MGRKSAKPTLHLVPPTGMVGNTPPRTLAEHGGSLWNRVMTEYQIEDVAGRELLALACQQLDRAEALKAQIDVEGEIIQTRNGPKEHPALRHELAGRAFVAKTLLRLGLNVEPLHQRPGRPPTGTGWIPPG